MDTDKIIKDLSRILENPIAYAGLSNDGDIKIRVFFAELSIHADIIQKLLRYEAEHAENDVFILPLFYSEAETVDYFLTNGFAREKIYVQTKYLPQFADMIDYEHARDFCSDYRDKVAGYKNSSKATAVEEDGLTAAA